MPIQALYPERPGCGLSGLRQSRYSNRQGRETGTGRFLLRLLLLSLLLPALCRKKRPSWWGWERARRDCCAVTLWRNITATSEGVKTSIETLDNALESVYI